MNKFEPTADGRLVFAAIEERNPGYQETVKGFVRNLGFEGDAIEAFTCARCPLVNSFRLSANESVEQHGSECPWAFDLYNTNGDCLAFK